MGIALAGIYQFVQFYWLFIWLLMFSIVQIYDLLINLHSMHEAKALINEICDVYAHLYISLYVAYVLI